MTLKRVFRHLSVKKFEAVKKNYVARKMGEGCNRLMRVKDNMLEATEDFSHALEDAIQNFRKELIDRICDIEDKIVEMKKKIETSGKEFKEIYQDSVDELEFTKNLLSNKLAEYRDSRNDRWDSYLYEFNSNKGRN